MVKHSRGYFVVEVGGGDAPFGVVPQPARRRPCGGNTRQSRERASLRASIIQHATAATAAATSSGQRAARTATTPTSPPVRPAAAPTVQLRAAPHNPLSLETSSLEESGARVGCALRKGRVARVCACRARGGRPMRDRARSAATSYATRRHRRRPAAIEPSPRPACARTAHRAASAAARRRPPAARPHTPDTTPPTPDMHTHLPRYLPTLLYSLVYDHKYLTT